MFLKSCGNYLPRGCFPVVYASGCGIVTIADHQEHSNAASTNDQARGSVAHNMLLIPGKARSIPIWEHNRDKCYEAGWAETCATRCAGDQPRSTPELGCVMQLDDATGALLIGVHHASIKGA